MLRDRPPAPPSSARRDPALLRAARPLGTPLTVQRPHRPARRRSSGRRRTAPTGRCSSRPPARSAATRRVELRAGRVGRRRDLDRGPRARRDRHGHLPRRRRHLGVRPSASRGSASGALFLQDAYVFTVIQNPLGIQDFGAITYKLASAGGHVQGAVTSDKADAIAGKVGAEPPSIPLHIVARNRAGETVTQDSLLADERDLGWGAGISLRRAARRSRRRVGRLMRRLRARPRSACACASACASCAKPMGFCNLYFSVRRRGQRRGPGRRPRGLLRLRAAPRGAHRRSARSASRRQGGRDRARPRATQGAQGLAHAGAAHRSSAGAARAIA